MIGVGGREARGDIGGVRIFRGMLLRLWSQGKEEWVLARGRERGRRLRCRGGGWKGWRGKFEHDLRPDCVVPASWELEGGCGAEVGEVLVLILPP